MSHTITSVRDTQNIQSTTTNEGQEVNIYDVPETNHTRRFYTKTEASASMRFLRQ